LVVAERIPLFNIIRSEDAHTISIQGFTLPTLPSALSDPTGGDFVRQATAQKQTITEEEVAHPMYWDTLEEPAAVQEQADQSEPGEEDWSMRWVDHAQEAARQCLAAAQEEAERCLVRAREEAERSLAAAKSEAITLKEEAIRQGILQGEECSKQMALAQCTAVLESFQQAVAEITGLRATVLRRAEEDIVTLAFHIARKIIRQEILLNRDVVLSTVRCALETLVDRDTILVRIHPIDLEQVQIMKKELLRQVKGIKNLTLQGDETIERGGCVVESRFGEIDARIEEQLTELEQRFREHLTLIPAESSDA
jgi:flagellar assembly protein FliH